VLHPQKISEKFSANLLAEETKPNTANVNIHR